MIMKKQVIIIGDTHGNFDYITFFVQPNTIYLHVGDFGVGFKYKGLEELERKLKECNSVLYAIAGNHDNRSYFVDNVEDDKVLYLLKDYSVVNLPNDKTVLMVGGAISVDRFHRTEGINYWSNEVFVLDESKIVQTDYLITHAAPINVFPIYNKGFIMTLESNNKLKLLQDIQKERNDIAKLVELVKPSKMFYGHYHKNNLDIVEGIEYRCLGTNELYQLRTEN